MLYADFTKRIQSQHIIIGAFFLAFFIRLLFVFDWMATPYATWPLLDAAAYHDWATAIANGEIIRPRAFYQSPLYPYLLGLFYALFGHGFFMVGLINTFLGGATASLLARFTMHHFGRLAAIGTTLLFAFYRPSIFYTPSVMKEPLVLFILAGLLPFAYAAIEKNKIKDYAYAGLLIGLGALTRGNFIFIAPALMLWAIIKYKKKATKQILTLGLMTILALAPAILHNAIASNDFVPINYADGFNLYIGHSPIANGTNAYPPEVSTDPIQEEINIGYIAQSRENKNLKPSEISAYWKGRAWDEIFKAPTRELSLLLTKGEAFWNSTERFDNYDSTFIKNNFDTLLSWPLIGFWILSTLAAFACIPALYEKNRPALFLLVLTAGYFASVMPFYVTDRYRLPVIVFLLPLAGAALSYGLHVIKRKQIKTLAGALTFALFFAFLGLKADPTPRNLTAFNWGTLATVYAGLGQNEKTIESLNQGLSIDPSEVGPSAYIQGTEAARKLKQWALADAYMNQAEKIYPDNGTVHYNRGRDFAARGQLKEAAEAFKMAMHYNPSYPLNYYALAMVLDKLGDYTLARRYAFVGIMIDPSDPYLIAYMATHPAIEEKEPQKK